MFLLLLVLLPAFTFVVLYLVGRIPLLDQVYIFFCGLLSIPLQDIADLLTVFKEKQLAGENKYPGLRSIVLLFALVFVGIAVIADSYTALDAVRALFGDVNIPLPSLPPLFGYSMGFLYVSLTVIFGGLYLDTKKFIVLEARIFTISNEEDERKFSKFIGNCFWLAVAATVAFFVDRWGFLNDSPITPLFQFITFLLIGILMPLLGMFSLYMLALGVQVVLSLVFTCAWFVASVSSHCLEYTHKHYLELSLAREVQRSATNKDTTIEEIPENEPVTALPSPAPYAGRTRAEFPIIDNGKPEFKERANWALDVLAEKAPHRLQELVEYLPKIEYDSSLINGNSWRANSGGFFGYDLSDDDTALFVLAHETGHNYHQIQHNDSSEDAANRYAHEVMVELERA